MADQRPGGDPPDAPDSRQPPSPKTEWVLALLLGGVVTVAIFYLTFSNQQTEPEETTPPAGWEELAACAAMKSIDENRQMELRADGTVVLTDLSPAREGETDQRKPTTTRWDYDSDSQRYSVVIGEKKEVYSLVKMRSPALCILLKGDAASADLNGSWFAVRNVRQDENSEQSDE
jgi:hypothetical protein